MNFAEALQTAIYERLSTYPGMPPVYDDVPANAPGHYIVIGEDTHAAWDTDDSLGAESTITLHQWDKSHRGKARIKQTQGLIYEALCRHELSVEGFSLVMLEFEYSDVVLDSDGRTMHGVMRFRSLVESN